MATTGKWINALGEIFTDTADVFMNDLGQWVRRLPGGGEEIVTPVDSAMGSSGIGADDAINLGSNDAIPLPPRTIGREEMTARLREIYGREPTYAEVDAAMGLDRGVTDVAVRNDQPTDVAVQDGGGSGGPTDLAVRNDGPTDVAVRGDAPTDAAVRGADDNIIDAEWREIDSAALADATKTALDKKGIPWKAIAAATIIGGVTYYLMKDGSVVDSNGTPASPSGGGGGGSNPNGIRPDDDPGGIGERGRGGGGTTSSGSATGTSSSGGGGGGGGGGSSYGSSQSSGGSSSRSGGNYPTLPMTDIRRMILTNISAANGGRPMGGFPTPPGGWDPRMESMFTTGAFEPQQASQEQVDAYNNKPRPSLPTPPWKKQQSQGAPSMPNPVVRNQGVPSYTDMMAKLQGNAASKSKPASAPAAGTKPSFPSVGMQPNAQQRSPFSTRPEGGYSFDGAPFPPGYAETPDNYAQRLAQAGFPSGYQPPPSMGMSMPAMGAAPTATAKPLTYQEMLAKIQGK